MTRRITSTGGISGIGAKVKRARRDWSLVNAKVEAEGNRCRACGAPAGGPRTLERAHVIGREHDYEPPVSWPSDVKWITRSRVYVVPTRIVPLCGPVGDDSTCHGKAHADRLDWLPLLTVPEQVQAVADAGGVYPALRRLIPYSIDVGDDGYDHDDASGPPLDIPF